jgi:predicted DNA-binding protein with PD1-like motif
MERVLEGAHEIAGVGTLFPDEENKPVLHMHVAAGRRGASRTGCVRLGVQVWQVAEVVIIELTRCAAMRKLDRSLGFKLLDPQPVCGSRDSRNRKTMGDGRRRGNGI